MQDPGPVITERLDEEEIIRRISSGDVDAYADIVRAYQSKVMGLCLSFLRETAGAEDAAQEIFIKAYRSLGAFRGRSSFSTWLYRIAANHCKDLLRKRSRHRTESLDELSETLGDAAEDLVGARPEPGISAENEERMEKVLSALSPDERVLLTLREAQGLSYQEIAGVLGCSLDAVKARLKRAREALDKKCRHFLEGKNV